MDLNCKLLYTDRTRARTHARTHAKRSSVSFHALMYRVVAASPAGDVTLWRTNAPAVEGAPSPCGALVTPLTLEPAPALEAPPPLRLPVDSASPTETVEAFCEARGLALKGRRKILNGEILFVHLRRVEEGTQPEYLVVKRQKLVPSLAGVAAAPGPAVCELCALVALNHLMAASRLLPVFCELRERVVRSDSISVVMCAYIADLAEWIRGDGRDPSRTCKMRPQIAMAANAAEPWVLTRCAGHQLATSEFALDRALFNETLRAALLQVFLGLAQAQRHCLFTHNDLHCGNVMFEHCPRSLSRLVVCGAGAFLLPRRSARVRIIDFQHADFDHRNGDDALARVSGGRDDVHNGFSLVYDVWRLCSNLLFELLRQYATAVEEDVLELLHVGAGVRVGAELPRLDAELHWKPYMLTGPLPEDMLAHQAFDRYRCAPDAAADEVYYERSPSDDAQERFVRTRVLRHWGALPVPREQAYAAFAMPVRAVNEAARRRLRVFAQNYEGTALGRALLYHKHTPAARARYLFMELCLLEAALDHLWGPACAEEVARRADSDLDMCALADAICTVKHADWLYIARPATMQGYNDAVLAAAQLPCVLAVGSQAPAPRRMGVREEEALLATARDADLERFRGIFVGLVVQ